MKIYTQIWSQTRTEPKKGWATRDKTGVLLQLIEMKHIRNQQMAIICKEVEVRHQKTIKMFSKIKYYNSTIKNYINPINMVINQIWLFNQNHIKDINMDNTNIRIRISIIRKIWIKIIWIKIRWVIIIILFRQKINIFIETSLFLEKGPLSKMDRGIKENKAILMTGIKMLNSSKGFQTYKINKYQNLTQENSYMWRTFQS